MSDTVVDVDQAARRARELIEADVNARVEAVRILAEAANAAEAAEARAKETASAHETAWKAAIAAGWTEKDLRATGVRAPGQNGRRPRRAPSSEGE